MRLIAISLLALCAMTVPFVASAQSGIPLFDPSWRLVPDAHSIDPSCPVGAPLGFGGVLQLVQNGMNAVVSFGVLAFVFVIVAAGFMWILTPTNPENHSRARKILTNAVIGLLIVLSAWLVVDFVMKVLYDAEGTQWGPWNEILTLAGGSACVVARPIPPLFSGTVPLPWVPDGNPGSGLTRPPATGIGACNPGLLQSLARDNGIPLSASDANTFACIARPESSCGTRLQNYAWGRGSSAYGAFQVLLDSNARFYETPACRRAAGLAEGQRLNCSAGFRNGNPIAGSEVVRRCVNAASNLACSLSAAAGLNAANGNSFRDWLSDRNRSGQLACLGR